MYFEALDLTLNSFIFKLGDPHSFFCRSYFANGSWPSSGFCSPFQALEPKGGNSAKFHQCCIKKDSLIIHVIFLTASFLKLCLVFIFILFRLFTDLPWTISTYLSFYQIWIYLLVYFFSTNSEVKGIVRCIRCGGKLNILGSKYWPIVCSLYICFLCSACISILLRSFFFFF